MTGRALSISLYSMADLEATKTLLDDARDAAQRSAADIRATKKELDDTRSAGQRSAADLNATMKQLEVGRCMLTTA